MHSAISEIPQHSRRFGLRGKLLLPIFAVTALALFTATFIATRSAEQILMDTAQEKLLNAAATAGNNIDLQIQRARVDIISASNVPDIKAVLDPSDTANFGDRHVFIDHANKLLALLGGASNTYETFYVTSDKGTTLACSMPSAVGTLDISNRQWFHDAMRGDGVVTSEPFVSRITGDTLMAVAMRFSYADHSGAMVGSLQLSKVIDPALRLSAREHFLTGVVTEAGTIIATDDGNLIGTSLSERPWFAAFRQANEGYLTFDDAFEDKALAFYKLPHTNLYAIAVAPTEELLAPVTVIRNTGAISLIFAMLAAYAVIYFSLAPTVHYTRELARKAHAIGQGDLQQELPLTRNDELGDLAQAISVMVANLKKMIFRAEEATKAKGDFLARMSHEIRTPLNAVIGMAYLGLQNTTDEKQHSAFSKIHSAAENLLGIINDVLDFSKIEAGKMTLESQPFSFRETLESIIELLKGRAAERDISLGLEIDDRIPDILVGDALRLSQICINLCTNAVKFTHQGGVMLSAALLADNTTFVTVRISVRDTGIGMTEEQQQTIFDAFTQADGSISRRFGGTGLGLAICKNIISLMHGDIWLESTPGHGSTFHFTVELPVHTEQTLHVPSQPHAPTAIPGAESLHVLVVEDNELNQEIAIGLLQLMGITPTIAGSGEEALAVCATEDFDLVFMDIQMPGMDGLETTRRIRATDRPWARTVPIIAMTANALSSDREKSQEVGMNAHITKPISYEELAETVRYWSAKDAGTA